jgi:hypothetical protein
MSESELKYNLARKLAEETPDHELHVVHIGDERHGGQVVFSTIEDHGFVSVLAEGRQKAWQGDAESMVDRFKTEVEGYVNTTPDSFDKPVSVEYRPARRWSVSFDFTRKTTIDADYEVTDE